MPFTLIRLTKIIDSVVFRIISVTSLTIAVFPEQCVRNMGLKRCVYREFRLGGWRAQAAQRNVFRDTATAALQP